MNQPHPETTRRDPLESKARRAFAQLSRSMNRLMRDQLSCGPVTVQQCYALEALCEGPLTMGHLAERLSLHQSTMTRIVEKLEQLNLAERGRSDASRRQVEVRISEQGRDLYRVLDLEGDRMVGRVLQLLPEERREAIVDALSELATVLAPDHEALWQALQGCAPTLPTDTEEST